MIMGRIVRLMAVIIPPKVTSSPWGYWGRSNIFLVKIYYTISNKVVSFLKVFKISVKFRHSSFIERKWSHSTGIFRFTLTYGFISVAKSWNLVYTCTSWHISEWRIVTFQLLGKFISKMPLPGLKSIQNAFYCSLECIRWIVPLELRRTLDVSNLWKQSPHFSSLLSFFYSVLQSGRF